jgi:serine acetyltransferase
MAAVVTKDVPANTVVIGHPARVAYSREEYNSKRERDGMLLKLVRAQITPFSSSLTGIRN